MHYRPLADTGLSVSALCLGTMTWGEQNSEADAHAQLDTAVDHGVNFIDTAEMYPVPPKAETQGLTEAYLGTWLEKRKDRDRLIVATKAAGPSRAFEYIRGEEPRFNRRHLTEALDASLRRLRTDYVDLYQLHWPERATNMFGQLGYVHSPESDGTPLAESLDVLRDLVRAGKVRHIGVSNETPWGVAKCLELANYHHLPRIASIQNPYSLLNRSFEIGLAELCLRENVGLLAYSPLAFGMLSGKYLDGARPADARLTLFDRFQRYTGRRAQDATARYVKIARDHGLDPAQMALAYVTSRVFVTSNIIGATTLAQLESNLKSAEIVLSDDVVAAIDAVQHDLPNPSP